MKKEKINVEQIIEDINMKMSDLGEALKRIKLTKEEKKEVREKIQEVIDDFSPVKV